MGARSRRRGYEGEREIVNLHRALGVEAKRVPLSGAVEGWAGDVIVAGLRGEVKARGSGDGFRVLERWLGDNDILFLRRNRAKPLALVPWKTWEKLIRGGSLE